MEEELLGYVNFLDRMAKIDPEYGLDYLFKINAETKKECLDMIREIEEIDKKMSIVDRAEKGKLSYEKGKLLEDLSIKFLNIRYIFKISERVECDSNEIDILLQPATNNIIYDRFIPEFLKKDILIECKNHKKNIDVTLLGKFYSLLRYKHCKFGIMISNLPLTGRNEWDAAVGLTKKFYLRDNYMIINLTLDRIKEILEGDINIIKALKKEVDHIIYHTDFTNDIIKHQGEATVWEIVS